MARKLIEKIAVYFVALNNNQARPKNCPTEVAGSAYN